jgi:hypothetical protein
MVRVASSDLRTGKRGGFRVLLDLVANETWVPILVYVKPQTDNVSREEILRAALEEVI